MKNWLPWTINAALASACGFALLYFVDPTTRAATAVAGLCYIAFLSPRRTAYVRKTDPLTADRGNEVKRTPPPQAPTPAVQLPDADDVPSLVERMLAQGRTALLLRPEIASSLPPFEFARAETALEESMALVPHGDVRIAPRGLEHNSGEALRSERTITLESFLLDRYPVTNREFQAFVKAGAYREMSLWEPAIWPAILQFVDRTGEPGPHDWSHGEFPAELHDHPVVGVSWFEAVAYARWVGKRLPTDPEWVKAAAWPIAAEGERPVQRRYPWGDAMDRRLANLWNSPQATTSVFTYPEGGSVNGIYDLVGNVWEWTYSPFDAHAPARMRWETDAPLRSIRGGAFDTYFDTQAASDFASGEDPFARRHNVGFRCAISLNELRLTDPRETTAVQANARETRPFPSSPTPGAVP